MHMHINIIVNYKSFQAVIEDRKVHMPLAFYLYIDRHQVPTCIYPNTQRKLAFYQSAWRHVEKWPGNDCVKSQTALHIESFFCEGCSSKTRRSSIFFDRLNCDIMLLFGTKSK